VLEVLGNSILDRDQVEFINDASLKRLGRLEIFLLLLDSRDEICLSEYHSFYPFPLSESIDPLEVLLSKLSRILRALYFLHVFIIVYLLRILHHLGFKWLALQKHHAEHCLDDTF
jgi:hypothetical protein